MTLFFYFVAELLIFAPQLRGILREAVGSISITTHTLLLTINKLPNSIDLHVK
jgi:hypothetical protein